MKRMWAHCKEAQHPGSVNFHLSAKTGIMFHHAEATAKALSEHKQASENETPVAQ